MTDKIRVVLDTNILVSALWCALGNASTLIRLMPRYIIPCFTEEIFSEYADVLNRPKFKFSDASREMLLAAIKTYGELVFPPKSDKPFADESDRIFYDTAKHCGAVLITGNLKHFPAEPFIMSPADFLTHIAGAWSS